VGAFGELTEAHRQIVAPTWGITAKARLGRPV
jgi:hypothetical protein